MRGGHWRKDRLAVRNRRGDALAQLAPADFEARVADHYRCQGYNVERVGHGGAHFDGGIDLKLRCGDEYIVVQCKRENAYQVTHNVGHELIGVMCTQGATGAIVVNSGEFTEAARRSAQREPRLQLVDGDEVRRWFPELTGAAMEPVWEPVGAARGGRERTHRRRHSGDGTRVAVAGMFVAAMMLWQCSRPNPRPDAAPAAAQPAVQPAAKPAASPSADGRASPEIAQQHVENVSRPTMSVQEWERRNRESMEILRETTPEIDLAP